MIDFDFKEGATTGLTHPNSCQINRLSKKISDALGLDYLKVKKKLRLATRRLAKSTLT
jgi:hypothetical protein